MFFNCLIYIALNYILDEALTKNQDYGKAKIGKEKENTNGHYDCAYNFVGGDCFVHCYL